MGNKNIGGAILDDLKALPKKILKSSSSSLVSDASIMAKSETKFLSLFLQYFTMYATYAVNRSLSAFTQKSSPLCAPSPFVFAISVFTNLSTSCSV